MRHNLHNRAHFGGRGIGGATRRKFLVVLPAMVGVASRVLRAQSLTRPRPGCERRWRLKPLVYVVDDTPEIAGLYRLLLEGAGYEVRSFNDRAEALRAFLAAKLRPSLLITDYVGYPISAEELMAACRRAQPDLKILMVSGCVAGSLSFDRIGPDRYLEKPFNIEEFLAGVKSLTGSSARHDPDFLQGF